jgi:hypothetical protein
MTFFLCGIGPNAKQASTSTMKGKFERRSVNSERPTKCTQNHVYSTYPGIRDSAIVVDLNTLSSAWREP